MNIKTFKKLHRLTAIGVFFLRGILKVIFSIEMGTASEDEVPCFRFGQVYYSEIRLSHCGHMYVWMGRFLSFLASRRLIWKLSNFITDNTFNSHWNPS